MSEFYVKESSENLFLYYDNITTHFQFHNLFFVHLVRVQKFTVISQLRSQRKLQVNLKQIKPKPLPPNQWDDFTEIYAQTFRHSIASVWTKNSLQSSSRRLIEPLTRRRHLQRASRDSSKFSRENNFEFVCQQVFDGLQFNGHSSFIG